MFKGSQGFLIADYTKRLLIPSGKNPDLSYYQPRAKKDQLPPIGQFHQQWIDACKDPSKETCCNFEYHSHLIEQMVLGLVAYRTGETLGIRRRQGFDHQPRRSECLVETQLPRRLDSQRLTPHHSAMHSRLRSFLLGLPVFPACLSAEPVKPVIDDTQPGWRAMTQEDFTKVNSADDTWTWKDDAPRLHRPTGQRAADAKDLSEFRAGRRVDAPEARR